MHNAQDCQNAAAVSFEIKDFSPWVYLTLTLGVEALETHLQTQAEFIAQRISISRRFNHTVPGVKSLPMKSDIIKTWPRALAVDQ